MAAGKEEPTFASFKGLGYVSMFMGVPLGPLLILFGAGVFGAFLFGMMFGWPGMIWPLLCAAMLMFLKILCETDNKALERGRWVFKAWRLRLKVVSPILTVSPNKPGTKNEHFFRRLKKIHRTG
jgi:type IV secretion system protein VirB3